MLKSYKYRIYPNKSQQVLLAKTFGCVRYFWNRQVETFNGYNKQANPNPVFLTSTQIRRETEWMQEVSAAANIKALGVDNAIRTSSDEVASCVEMSKNELVIL
jgi:putative transposase